MKTVANAIEWLERHYKWQLSVIQTVYRKATNFHYIKISLHQNPHRELSTKPEHMLNAYIWDNGFFELIGFGSPVLAKF